MAGNINDGGGAPPPPVIHPPVVPQAVVLPPAPPPVVHPPVGQQPVGQEPQPGQQPVENDDNIAGAPPAEPLFIGPHNLVGPRLPPIEDIVANDQEIRRICSELATMLNNLIGNNKENLMNLASGTGYGYNQVPYQQKQYSSPPISLEGWGIITENTLLQQIKWYVKMATHLEPNRRHGFNFQAAIVGLETSITATTEGEKTAAEHDSRNSANTHGFFQHRYNAARIAASVTLGAGSIGGIFTQLLQSTYNFGENLRMREVRPYCDLILQLYRRIQAILIENGFQQGGKKKNNKQTIKRKKINSKQSSKRRKLNSKQSKKRK
jgi:hypothetical protein